MQFFESKALNTFANPQTTWKRYVDDTFAKLKICNVDSLLCHLNSQHPQIKFTTEMPENDCILGHQSTAIGRQNSIIWDIQETNAHRPIPSLRITSPRQTENRNHKDLQTQINTIITKEQDKITEKHM